MAVSEIAIWERIIRPDREMNLVTAKAILKLSFSNDDRTQMKLLLYKAKDGTITPNEQLQIDEFERTGNLLSILKAKARKVVQSRNR